MTSILTSNMASLRALAVIARIGGQIQDARGLQTAYINYYYQTIEFDTAHDILVRIFNSGLHFDLQYGLLEVTGGHILDASGLPIAFSKP